MKNTIPSPFFVVSLFVARLRWCHGSRGSATLTTRELSRPLYSGTKLQWKHKPTRTEPYRTMQWKSAKRLHCKKRPSRGCTSFASWGSSTCHRSCWNSYTLPLLNLSSGRLLPSRPEADRGRKDAPQRPGPFFPEMHDEIKKSWNMPLTSRVHNPGSSLLSSVDGADKWGMPNSPLWKKPSLPIFVLQPRRTGEWETMRLSPLNLAAPLKTSLARLSTRRARQLQHCTWWQYSRCIRPNYSRLWMKMGRTLKCSKSSDAPQIWPSERRRWRLERSAAIWGILWC